MAATWYWEQDNKIAPSEYLFGGKIEKLDVSIEPARTFKPIY